MLALLFALCAWLTSQGVFKVTLMPKSGVNSASNVQKSPDILADWIVETSDGVKHGYAKHQ